MPPWKFRQNSFYIRSVWLFHALLALLTRNFAISPQRTQQDFSPTFAPAALFFETAHVFAHNYSKVQAALPSPFRLGFVFHFSHFLSSVNLWVLLLFITPYISYHCSLLYSFEINFTSLSRSFASLCLLHSCLDPPWLLLHFPRDVIPGVSRSASPSWISLFCRTTYTAFRYFPIFQLCKRFLAPSVFISASVA